MGRIDFYWDNCHPQTQASCIVSPSPYVTYFPEVAAFIPSVLILMYPFGPNLSVQSTHHRRGFHQLAPSSYRRRTPARSSLKSRPHVYDLSRSLNPISDPPTSSSFLPIDHYFVQVYARYFEPFIRPLFLVDELFVFLLNRIHFVIIISDPWVWFFTFDNLPLGVGSDNARHFSRSFIECNGLCKGRQNSSLSTPTPFATAANQLFICLGKYLFPSPLHGHLCTRFYFAHHW